MAAAADAVKAARLEPTAARILHVVSSVDLGGIEISLLQVLRHIDRQRYPMDFFVLNAGPGALEQDLRALGSRVVYCSDPRNPWMLARCFSRALRQHGPYDIVHSHVHYFGGAILRLAAHHRIPVRIAHSRNDLRTAKGDGSYLRRLYSGLMKNWIDRYATVRIAVSAGAGEDLFGPLGADQSYVIIRSGRDFSSFSDDVDVDGVRSSLGLPRDAFVIGHVGRFHARKNHAFLIEITADVFRQRGDGRLLLVGDGPLLPEIQAQVAGLGLSERTVFAGARTDVAGLMKAAIDVLIMPSYHEGLSMVLVEAQAAGLPCICSEGLTEESDIVPRLVRRLPLSRSAADWASAALALAAASKREIGPRQALDAVLESDFNIEKSAAKLAHVYESERSKLGFGRV